jgi:hypothetical protein
MGHIKLKLALPDPAVAIEGRIWPFASGESVKVRAVFGQCPDEHGKTYRSPAAGDTLFPKFSYPGWRLIGVWSEICSWEAPSRALSVERLCTIVVEYVIPATTPLSGILDDYSLCRMLRILRVGMFMPNKVCCAECSTVSWRTLCHLSASLSSGELPRRQ